MCERDTGVSDGDGVVEKTQLSQELKDQQAILFSLISLQCLLTVSQAAGEDVLRGGSIEVKVQG